MRTREKTRFIWLFLGSDEKKKPPPPDAFTDAISILSRIDPGAGRTAVAEEDDVRCIEEEERIRRDIYILYSHFPAAGRPATARAPGPDDIRPPCSLAGVRRSRAEIYEAFSLSAANSKWPGLLPRFAFIPTSIMPGRRPKRRLMQGRALVSSLSLCLSFFISRSPPSFLREAPEYVYICIYIYATIGL